MFGTLWKLASSKMEEKNMSQYVCQLLKRYLAINLAERNFPALHTWDSAVYRRGEMVMVCYLASCDSS